MKEIKKANKNLYKRSVKRKMKKKVDHHWLTHHKGQGDEEGTNYSNINKKGNTTTETTEIKIILRNYLEMHPCPMGRSRHTRFIKFQTQSQ